MGSGNGLVVFVKTLMSLSPDLTERLDALLASHTPPAISESSPAPRLVLDTNVVLDWLFWQDPGFDPLLELIQSQRVTLLANRATLLECLDVLARPLFFGDLDRAQAALITYLETVQLIDETLCASCATTLTVECRDPDDQKFLVLATASNAQYLISKDKLVLKAGRRLRRWGVETLTPASFGKRLKENG